MLITGKRSLSSFLRIVVDLLLFLNILALLLLPWLLQAVYENPTLLQQLEAQVEGNGPDSTLRSEYPSDLPESSYPFYLGFLYVSGLSTAWLLFEGHRILRRMERNEPFAAGQSVSFRRVGCSFGVLVGVFAVKIATYNTLLTMFCCALFLILVLTALILSEVFRQAYVVKSENDLTV